MFMILVDCQWGEFDDWSSCSKTCGNGTRWSNRVKTQKALHGGQECEGQSERSEQCNVNKCPGT